MSVLSDVASKLQQAQSAASNKSKTANYGEALGFIISDMLNTSASDLNPFIRKGAAARVHFNELDAVEEERERLLGYKDGSEGLGGSGFSKNGSSGGSLGAGGALAMAAGALALKKLFKRVFSKFFTRVAPNVVKKTLLRSAVGAIAGPPGIAIAATVGTLWGAYDIITGLVDILDEEGVDVSGFRDFARPLTDSLEEAANFMSYFAESDLIKEASEVVEKVVTGVPAAAKVAGTAAAASASSATALVKANTPAAIKNTLSATSTYVANSLIGPQQPEEIVPEQTTVPTGIPGNEKTASILNAAGNATVTKGQAPLPARAALSSAAKNMATGDYGGMDMDITGIARTVDIEALKELIFGAESKAAGYDQVVGNKTIIDANGNKRKPTDMTVGEIKDWQEKAIKDGWASTAVGAYQIVSTTMNESYTTKGIPDSAKFTPEVQDKMFNNLLEHRKIRQFESGAITGREFIFELSKEWAGLKNMSGQGYHDKQDPITGAWINKASASPESLASTFRQTAVPIGGDRPANLPSPHRKKLDGPTPPTKYVPSSPTSQVKQNLNPGSTQTKGSEAANTSNPAPKTQPIILPQALPPVTSVPAQSSNHQYQTPSMARLPSAFDMLIASDMMRTV